MGNVGRYLTSFGSRRAQQGISTGSYISPHNSRRFPTKIILSYKAGHAERCYKAGHAERCCVMYLIFVSFYPFCVGWRGTYIATSSLFRASAPQTHRAMRRNWSRAPSRLVRASQCRRQHQVVCRKPPTDGFANRPSAQMKARQSLPGRVRRLLLPPPPQRQKPPPPPPPPPRLRRRPQPLRLLLLPLLTPLNPPLPRLLPK